jgi:hypothetical protein
MVKRDPHPADGTARVRGAARDTQLGELAAELEATLDEGVDTADAIPQIGGLVASLLATLPGPVGGVAAIAIGNRAVHNINESVQEFLKILPSERSDYRLSLASLVWETEPAARSSSKLAELLLGVVNEELPEDDEGRLVGLLGQIAAKAALANAIRAELEGDVSEARELQATWAEIARAAGIRPQTAYKKWDPAGKESHRKYMKDRYSSTDADET